MTTNDALRNLGLTVSAQFNLRDEPIALGCVGAFLLVIVFVLVWTFVIAPRRSRRLLQELELRGYVAIERRAPELESALDSLAPILLEGTTRFAEGSRQ